LLAQTTLALIALLAAGCSETLAPTSVAPMDAPKPAVMAAQAASAAAQPQPAARPIPATACGREARWPFFRAFVAADPRTRAAHSIGNAADSFRIVLVDNRWTLAVPGSAPGRYPRVELTEAADEGGFVMRYVRAEYAPNEDLIRTVGEPGGYRFMHRDGCWRLAGEVVQP
jgi:hypothetical protein